MASKLLVVHFGELSTKGDNKKQFIDCLYRNISHALKEYGPSIKKTYDHIYIHLEDRVDEILYRLKEIPGIQRISLSEEVEKDIDKIKRKCSEILNREKPISWKAKVKRADKKFGTSSMQLAQEIGAYCLSHGAPKVDVHGPQMPLSIEIRIEGAYISYKEYPGAGGYPLGMNGKVLTLLSGGIDSPVAAYLLIRRGLLIECLHFASPPYTSEAVIDKLNDIIKLLNVYQAKIKLHVVPFTKLQEAIYEHVAEPYCITIMRRMMLRVAEKAARKFGCAAIATGESVGQVASQTLESMLCINEVTSYPILRPLAVSDKLDIIITAKKIGTYDISIRPYEDCCTIFAPKAPKTKPKSREAAYYESKFDFMSLIDKAVEGIKDIDIIPSESNRLF